MRYWRKYDLKKLFLENGRYIVTVVHETGNLKKIMFLCVLLCPPVLLTASEGFHLPEENKVRCQLQSMRAGCQSLANSDQTVKLGSADQIWINILLL